MSSAATSQNDRQTLLKPPQFGLRTLFLVVAMFSALFAAMSALGGLWSLALLLLLCLMAAHVIGNALGTRLRDEAEVQSSEVTSAPRSAEAVLIPAHSSSQRLTQHTRMGRAAVAMAVLGAAGGGWLGFAALDASSQPVSPLGLALGAVSSAVLGAFAGFLGSSFLSVARAAWREALTAAEKRSLPSIPAKVNEPA